MNISTKEETRLRKIAKQNDVKGGYPTVKKMYDEKIKELKEKGLKANLDRFAVSAVLNHYRRIKQKQKPMLGRAKATPLYGFIVGDMGMRDKAEEIRREAKRFIDKNSVQAAIEAQLINGDNRILDTRETVYGKPNPNHLEVLDKDTKRPLKIRSHVLTGFFRKNGSKTFKYSTIQTSDNKLARAWTKIKFFLPCQTFGIIKEEDKTDMRINSSQAEGTESVFKAVKEKWDVNDIMEKALKNRYTKIQNAEKHYETFKDAWDRKIFLRGIVAWINVDRPTPWGAIWMGLMDPDDEESLVRVQIPQHILVDFGELSEIRVFGRTKRSKYKDSDTNKLVDGDVIVMATGLYPIPGLSTPKESGVPETLEEEEEIEGWLD